jgi:hypothetical protein
MQKHRITVDLKAGTAKPTTVETIEIAPGDIYYRAWDDSLRRIDGEGIHNGDAWIATAWHDDAGSAWAEAAEELTRRIQRLASIRIVCLAGQEVKSV